ncbi:MAG: BadF/BadG/BcrA/BcrD ATPase family protein, partial [Pseudolysinimonas sp.]
MGVTDRGLIVGVDGGGSKTHAVALTLDGELVGRGDGPGSSPHWIGVEASIDIVDAAVRTALGGGTAAQANVYLSGLDLEVEVAAYATALGRVAWAGAGTVVANDLWALLRAGTESPDAVAVICGTGINAVGVRADGATVRFAALGPISGDWG